MQLIDRNETVQQIMNDKISFIGTHEQVESHDAMCDYAIDCITSAPVFNALPAVRGVVRCKDCVHKNKFGYCDIHSEDPNQYGPGYSFSCGNGFFCAYGEQKDNDSDIADHGVNRKKFTAVYEVQVEFEADDEAKAEEIAEEIEKCIDINYCDCHYGNFTVSERELISDDDHEA